MRTRFLATDYFASSPAPAPAAAGTNGTVDFLRLPLPDLPLSNLRTISDDLIQSFNDIPVLTSTLEIGNLPIGEAVSKFLDDVLPHVIDDVDFKVHNVVSSVERLSSEGKDETLSIKENIIETLQFEVPEIDPSLLSLKSEIYSRVEDVQIFNEIPNAEFDINMTSMELRPHDLLDIQNSLYPIEDIDLEYSLEQKIDFFDNAGTAQGCTSFHDMKFPLFEVDEESLGICKTIDMEDEHILFENIELQHWTQLDEAMNDGKVLLGSLSFDIMAYLSGHCPPMECLKVEDNISYFPPQMEYISLIEQSQFEGYSLYCQEKADNSTGSMFLFEEFQFFDLDPSYSCDVFSNAVKEIEEASCESLFGEAMNFRNFNELIVSHELAFMDNSFKSLPVPFLSDHVNGGSLHSLVENILVQSESQSSSTSDGLYLNWDLLDKDNCVSGKYSSCWNMLFEINTYSIDVSGYLMDSVKPVLDFILSDDVHGKSILEDCKEMLNEPYNELDRIHSSVDKINQKSKLDHGDQKNLSGEALPKAKVDKFPSLMESMSSDLDFFLNPISRKERENKPIDKSVDANAMSPVLLCSNGFEQQWHVKLHKIKLSDNIIELIDNMQKFFESELNQMHCLYGVPNDMTLLHIPKEKLVDCIRKQSIESGSSAYDDDNILLLVMLSVIKQIAFYLCYYGVHAAYVYINQLLRSLQCLKSRLTFLYTMIKDANEKTEKEIVDIHPSLSVVKKILQTNLGNSSSKILIVSDQVFWWPLKKLLTSMNISYDEPEQFCAHSSQQDNCCEVMDAKPYSDCYLVSHEHVSASFPFGKFSLVLEYGGSNRSSRISTICPKFQPLPILYFLKVELEDLSIAKALSDGIDIPKNTEREMNGEFDSILVPKESKNRFEELLNFVPIKEIYEKGHVEAVKEDKARFRLLAQSMSMSMESKQTHSCKPVGADTIIVMNTQNFDKEMVISRRSTYQKILAMEKEGAQVVERDVNIPVDVIVTASTCLAWYDCKNIGKKASASDEAFSCLPLCVESIAANILTSLSFAFSCCVLIFEGDSNFLGSIMESSDELYAAAASLGLDIQLFCSYSPEMTEEIIVSCIKPTTKLIGGAYNKMPDSESLVESFLTAFPSIHPLSAHAISCSGGILVKFLELSSDDRIRALQEYQVPEESLRLLSSMTRYGEREDSTSGTTDCSSISSAPDSKHIRFSSSSQRKKQKYDDNLQNSGEIPMDLFHFEPLELLPDERYNPPRDSVSGKYWLSEDGKVVSDKPGKSSLSFNGKSFSPCDGLDTDIIMMNNFNMSMFHDPSLAKGLQIPDELETTKIPQMNKNCGPRCRSDMTSINSFNRQNTNLQESFIGEVIDIEDTSAFAKKFPSGTAACLSPFLLDMERDFAERSSRMNNPFFSASSLPTVTDTAEICSASDAWISVSRRGQNLGKAIAEDVNRADDYLPIMNQRGLLREGMIEQTPRNSYKPSFKETGAWHYGATPLSNALRSNQSQQGSPWTIEFLNRIREKSRLRQQSLPSNVSSPRLGYSGKTSHFGKTKSPSMLEFSKYRGSSQKKIVGNKRQRRSAGKSSLKKNETASAICLQSSTPIDKKARRPLSFAINGSGGQSKLVWGDNTLNRRL